MNTCGIDGCGKPHRARGLCSTHYNHQHQPNRHRVVQVPCGYCGTLVTKQATTKFTSRFCSLLCRDLWRIESAPNGDPMAAARAARQPAAKRPVTRCRIPDDHPARWIGDSSAVRYDECNWCGHVYAKCATNWRRIYCTRRCKLKAKAVRRRTSEQPGCFGEWTWSGFMRIAARFDYCCAYCDAKPDHLEPDHVLAVSRGGPNVVGNLLPACQSCNGDKRELTLTEWAEDRRRRRLAPRRTAWAGEDRRYWHLTFGQVTHAA